MPQTKSAKKALRRDRRREKVNKLVRRELKNILRSTRKKADLKSLALASRALDMAAKKGVIPKNKAARLKSRLAKLAKTTTPAAKISSLKPKRLKKTKQN